MAFKQDWSKGDWKEANAIQQAFDNSDIFPIVLNDCKNDTILTTMKIQTFDELIESQIKTPENKLDDDIKLLEVDSENDSIESSCKSEAHVRNESFYGGRRDDGDSSQLMINRLKREVSNGSSILSVLQNINNQTCIQDYRTNDYSVSLIN